MGGVHADEKIDLAKSHGQKGPPGLLTPSRRSRLRDRFLGSLFGHDLFISHSGAEGTRYARAFANTMQGEKPTSYACYLDDWAAWPGDAIPAALLAALRRSSMLVVIGTKEAFDSPNVEKEIAEYVRANLGRNRSMAVIDLASPEDVKPVSSTWKAVGRVTIAETPKVRVPTTDVLRALKDIARFTTRAQRLRRAAYWTIAGVISLLLAASGLTLWMIERATQAAAEAKAAREERSRAEAAKATAEAAKATAEAAKATAEAARAEEERKKVDAVVARDVAQKETGDAKAALMDAKRETSDVVARRASALAELPGREAAALTEAIRSAADNRRTPHVYKGLFDAIRAALLLKPARLNSPTGERFTFSRNGLRAASVGYDKVARVWSLNDGTLLAELKPEFAVQRVALSPDGSLLASTATRYDLRGDDLYVWNVNSKELLTRQPLARDEAYNLEFSEDGSYLHVDGGGIAVFDAKHWARLVDLPDARYPQFLAGGRLLAASLNTVELWDLTRTQRIWASPVDGALTGLAGSNTAKVFVTWGMRSFQVHSLETGTAIETHKSDSWIHDIALSPDGTRVVVGNDAGDVIQREIGAVVGYAPLKLDGPAFKVVWSDAGDGFLATTTAGGKAWFGRRVLDLGALTELREARFLSGDQSSVLVQGDRLGSAKIVATHNFAASLGISVGGPCVPDAQFGSHGQQLITSSCGGDPGIWDAKSGRKLASLPGHDAPVDRVALSADGRLAVTVDQKDHVRLFDVGQRKLLRELEGFEYRGSSAKFSANGHLVLFAPAGRLWDTTSGKVSRLVQDDARSVVALAPDASFLVVGDDSGTRGPVLRSTRTAAILSRLGDQPNPTAVAVSPTGATVAIGYWNGMVELWSRQGVRLQALKGPRDPCKSLDFSTARPQVVASCGFETRVWNVTSGKLEHTFPHRRIGDSTFCPDGALILTSEAGSPRLWDSISGELVAEFDPQLEFGCGTFSPSGDHLVLCAPNGKVEVYETTISGLLRQACAIMETRAEASQVRELCRRPPTSGH